jgi:hypothetical protein
VWDKSSRELDARSMYTVFRLQEVGGARLLGFDPKGDDTGRRRLPDSGGQGAGRPGDPAL